MKIVSDRCVALVLAVARWPLGPTGPVGGAVRCAGRERRRPLERRRRRVRSPPAVRPPAAPCSAAMVHGAMYDAVAAVEGGLEPFATGVTAPPARRRTQPSRRPRGTCSSPACRGRRRPSRSRTTPTWRRFPTGPRRTRGRPSARRRPRACSRCGPATTSTTSCRTCSRRRGPGVFEPIAATPPVDAEAPVRAAVHVRLAVGLPARAAVRADEQALRARTWPRCRPYGRADSSARTAEQTETVRFHTEQTFVQFSRTLRDARERPWPRPARVGAAAGLRLRGRRRTR